MKTLVDKKAKATNAPINVMKILLVMAKKIGTTINKARAPIA